MVALRATSARHFTTYDDGLGEGQVDVQAALQDRRGRLWIVTWGNGVYVHNGTGFEALTERDGLAYDTVGNILEDDSGDLWFGTPWRGVSRYDGSEFVTYTTADGLGSDYMTSLRIARAICGSLLAVPIAHSAAA
jgi:ligand-binding sensor domain-containing protein